MPELLSETYFREFQALCNSLELIQEQNGVSLQTSKIFNTRRTSSMTEKIMKALVDKDPHGAPKYSKCTFVSIYSK